MKKRKLNKLTLNKSTISKFNLEKIKGGTVGGSGPCESSQVIDHCVLACDSIEASNCASNCPC